MISSHKKEQKKKDHTFDLTILIRSQGSLVSSAHFYIFGWLKQVFQKDNYQQTHQTEKPKFGNKQQIISRIKRKKPTVL
jgi:hypothetical protein